MTASKNIIAQFTITSSHADDTRKLGQWLGERVTAGTVIALIGDLGTGKTAFVQGLALGLGVPEDDYITSPTYTIINEYRGRHRLFHVDLYRISAIEDLNDVGFSEKVAGNGITAIEWADRVSPAETAPDIELRFNAIDDTTRQLDLFFYGRRNANLVEGMRNDWGERGSCP